MNKWQEWLGLGDILFDEHFVNEFEIRENVIAKINHCWN